MACDGGWVGCRVKAEGVWGAPMEGRGVDAWGADGSQAPRGAALLRGPAVSSHGWEGQKERAW